jgi:hypothetical protein
MSRLRPYTPKRPEDRFKYVPGLAGFEAMVHAVVCHQVAGARLASARATPTWLGRSIIGQSAVVMPRPEPHLVWPEDQAWFLACEVDEEIEFTVGCSGEASQALAGALPGAVRRVRYGEPLRCTATRPSPSTRISSRVGRWPKGLAGRRSSRSARRGSVPRRTVERAPSGDSARSYQELPAPLTIPATAEQAAAKPVCLCIANAGRDRPHMPRTAKARDCRE